MTRRISKWAGHGLVPAGGRARVLAYLGMTALLAISPAAAQTGKDPSQKSDSTGQGLSTSAEALPRSAILSDTMGVDFSQYLKLMMAQIDSTWRLLVPQKAQKPEMKKGIVTIRVTILPDGRIGTMALLSKSGDIDLDKAAWYAIAHQHSFAALPAAFHGPQLELRLNFFYNVADPKAGESPAPGASLAH